MSWLPSDNASLTNRVDLLCNSLSLFVHEDGKEDVRDVQDIFLNYGSIARSEEEVVPIGGGYTYTQTAFPEEDITDWKVPGLSSLLRVLDNTVRKKPDDMANRLPKKISYFNNEPGPGVTVGGSCRGYEISHPYRRPCVPHGST